MKKDNKTTKFLKKTWERLGPRGRTAVASVAFIGVTAIPFPTVPITFALGATVVWNSPAAQKGVALIRRKWPNKTKDFFEKAKDNKKVPKFVRSMLKDLNELTDPDKVLKQKNKERTKNRKADIKTKSRDMETVKNNILKNKNKHRKPSAEVLAALKAKQTGR